MTPIRFVKKIVFLSALVFICPLLWAQQSVPDNMVRIEGGTFMMGSPANELGRHDDVELLSHEVTVGSFFMGKYEVTQKEYREVIGANPSYFKGDNLPVESVSWFDAVEYCNALSRREGLVPAYTVSGSGDDRIVTWNSNANGYRLPTEAEWEYACRAGTTTPFSTGNNITTRQANYNGSQPYGNRAKGTDRKTTTAVGSFAPNPWGLYDMHGNVNEWCWDWFRDFSQIRIYRGGSWSIGAQFARSANISYAFPYNKFYWIGFRVARNAQ